MKIVHSPSSSKGYVLPGLLAFLAIVVVITGLYLVSQFDNFRVPAGYAGYMFNKPIFGQGKYEGVLIGPTSSGFRWRIQGQLVSVTPYTYSEQFTTREQTEILAKDKLSIQCDAHIVWRLKPVEPEIRRFIESFGGWAQDAEPDKVASEAYINYIQQPFRTITRSVIAQYDGLEVNESLPAISTMIENQLKDRLASAPFDVIQVVMGNAAPPQEVIDAISAKVASSQQLEQRWIQYSIESANVEVNRKIGEASGTKMAAEAIQQANAIRTITAAITPAYIQYLAVDNLKGADRVYVPVGANGLPVVGTVPLNAPAKAPVPAGTP